MEMYEVGGCVRDELLGVKSKDIDFSVVLDPSEITPRRTRKGTMVERTPFEVMDDELTRRGFKIFLRTPQFLTIRAQFPRMDNLALVGRDRRNLTADFVLARKEGEYTDGRRPDKVEVGTLTDDLRRRDFTMNAIAKDAEGNLIDPFGGREDIEKRQIRAVGSAHERFEEDALRMLRAVRFKVTKGFTLHHDIMQALHNTDLLERLVSVSDERIMDELNKALRFNTLRTLQVLDEYKDLRAVLFSGSVSLDATMKQKGRGR